MTMKKDINTIIAYGMPLVHVIRCKYEYYTMLSAEIPFDLVIVTDI